MFVEEIVLMILLLVIRRRSSVLDTCMMDRGILDYSLSSIIASAAMVERGSGNCNFLLLLIAKIYGNRFEHGQSS